MSSESFLRAQEFEKWLVEKSEQPPFQMFTHEDVDYWREIVNDPSLYELAILNVMPYEIFLFERRYWHIQENAINQKLSGLLLIKGSAYRGKNGPTRLIRQMLK